MVIFWIFLNFWLCNQWLTNICFQLNGIMRENSFILCNLHFHLNWNGKKFIWEHVINQFDWMLEMLNFLELIFALIGWSFFMASGPQNFSSRHVTVKFCFSWCKGSLQNKLYKQLYTSSKKSPKVKYQKLHYMFPRPEFKVHWCTFSVKFRSLKLRT